MIHAVTVVPIWAPIITLIACNKVSNPALTNDTVIRVVAVELCTAAVTKIPVRIPVKRLVVAVPWLPTHASIAGLPISEYSRSWISYQTSEGQETQAA